MTKTYILNRKDEWEMKSEELYNKLKSDFIKEGITDLNWADRMPNLDKYLHDDFKQYGMGLMCDFTEKIDVE